VARLGRRGVDLDRRVGRSACGSRRPTRRSAGASWRTSLATTAKPLPASPARAASTAALSDSMLVWKARSSITATTSAKRCERPASAASRPPFGHRAVPLLAPVEQADGERVALARGLCVLRHRQTQLADRVDRAAQAAGCSSVRSDRRWLAVGHLVGGQVDQRRAARISATMPRAGRGCGPPSGRWPRTRRGHAPGCGGQVTARHRSCRGAAPAARP